MEEILRKRPWIKIVLSIILLALGITTTILACLKQEQNLIAMIVFIAIAVINFAVALLLIFGSIRTNPTKIFPAEIGIAGVLIGLGVAFCFPEVSNGLWGILLYLIDCILIAGGAVAIIKSVVLIVKKQPAGSWIAMMVLGLIFAVGGVLLLIFNKEVTQAVNIVIGILIGVAGLVGVVTSTIETVRASKAKK